MADLTRSDPTADDPAETAITDSARPCACYTESYAQGREKSHFKNKTFLDSNHADNYLYRERGYQHLSTDTLETPRTRA